MPACAHRNRTTLPSQGSWGPCPGKPRPCSPSGFRCGSACDTASGPPGGMSDRRGKGSGDAACVGVPSRRGSLLSRPVDGPQPPTPFPLLQMLGFTDLQAGTCMALFGLGCAIGSLVGGSIGARRVLGRWLRGGDARRARLAIVAGTSKRRMRSRAYFYYKTHSRHWNEQGMRWQVGGRGMAGSAPTRSQVLRRPGGGGGRGRLL